MNNKKNNEPIVSIGPNGIKINTPPGSSVKTNATHTYMKGIKQVSSGGKISHKAKKKLIQKDNEMTATNKGKIINEVEEGGLLYQEGNKMTADSKGEIINRVKSKSFKIISLVVVISVLADIITLITDGKHFWDLISGI